MAGLCHVLPIGFSLELIGYSAIMFDLAALGSRPRLGPKMNTALTLIDLAGSIALLLWGVHMVQSGVQRAFGPHLRRFLGRTLGGRGRAFLAGLGVTAVLQQHRDRFDPVPP
jgi:Na+/Pi-cotransporter